MTPALPPVIDRMVATCRELMGDAAFDEATAEGRTWPLLDALDRTSAAWEQDPVTTENRV